MPENKKNAEPAKRLWFRNALTGAVHEADSEHHLALLLAQRTSAERKNHAGATMRKGSSIHVKCTQEEIDQAESKLRG